MPERSAFSLFDEARNTEQHHSHWQSSQKLRYQKVDFVRGSELVTQDPELSNLRDSKHSPNENSQPAHPFAPKAEADSLRDLPPHLMNNLDSSSGRSSREANLRRNVPEIGGTLLFRQSFTGAKESHAAFQTKSVPPMNQSVSPTDSCRSEEEEVLFKGRTGGPLGGDDIGTPQSEAPIREFRNGANPETSRSGADIETVTLRHGQSSTTKRRGHRGGKRFRRHVHEDEDENDDAGILADYIANMERHEQSSVQQARRPYRTRNLALFDQKNWQVKIEDSSSSGGVKPSASDLDDRSPSQDVPDDDRWVTASFLTATKNTGLVQSFDKTLVGELSDNSESDTDESTASGKVRQEMQRVVIADFEFDEDEEEDESDDVDATDDEKELIRSKIATMSDEKLARLIAKQEELGLDADELVLFDGSDAEIEDTGVDVPRQPGKTKPPRLRRSARLVKGNLASAAVMADWLGQGPSNKLDWVDTKSPSVLNQTKKHKMNWISELSDPELKEVLISQWQADRNKKRIKKQERGALRAQGLLGRRGGITMPEIQEEIKQLLMSTNERYVIVWCM